MKKIEKLRGVRLQLLDSIELRYFKYQHLFIEVYKKKRK